jgi:hypothetical protein
VQTAILFGVYTPELFPTEIRLRANGICNTLGRGATVVSPFIVGSLMTSYQLPGVGIVDLPRRKPSTRNLVTARPLMFEVSRRRH